MDPVTLCECLSPQELRVKDRIDGKVDRFRKTHERSFRMLERFDGKKPVIDIERALYFTQSMKETEGQPLVLRWAKALRKIAENITVTVEDDMLPVPAAAVMASFTLNLMATSLTSPSRTCPPVPLLLLPSILRTPGAWLRRSPLTGRARRSTKL